MVTGSTRSLRSSRWPFRVVQDWDGEILVPFCLESKLGGVQRLLSVTEALWYRRTFETPKSDNKRLALNFEAVDYHSEVFVNGTSVGEHTGGNTPFSFDITDAVKVGENELVVRVKDATEEYQFARQADAQCERHLVHSGVRDRQTVWLEETPTRYLRDIKVSTDAGSGSITVQPITQAAGTVRVVVRDEGNVVAESSGSAAVTVTVPKARLWSPSSPHLYDLEVILLDAGGKPLDQVDSYAGIRDVGKVKDADGHWRFTLNGDILFHWGPLDQGWWPDGLLDATLRRGHAIRH